MQKSPYNPDPDFITQEFQHLGQKIEELNEMIGNVDQEIKKIKTRENSRSAFHSRFSPKSLAANNNSANGSFIGANRFVFLNPKTNAELVSQLDKYSAKLSAPKDDVFSFSNPNNSKSQGQEAHIQIRDSFSLKRSDSGFRKNSPVISRQKTDLNTFSGENRAKNPTQAIYSHNVSYSKAKSRFEHSSCSRRSKMLRMSPNVNWKEYSRHKSTFSAGEPTNHLFSKSRSPASSKTNFLSIYFLK